VWQATILSTDSNEATVIFPRFDRYAESGFQGTSMASPHVAGLAALLVSQIPTITPAQNRIHHPDDSEGHRSCRPRRLVRVRTHSAAGRALRPGHQVEERMRTPLIVLVAAVVCVAPVAATRAFAGQEQAPAQAAVISFAQKPPAQTTKPKPKTPKLPVGFRFFGAVESMSMAASSTFEAQGGSSMVLGFGAGAEVLNIWQKLFLRVGYSTGSVEGTRGFVINGDFVSNGIPLKLGVQNFELGAGWRSYLKKHPSIAWYIAGGLNIGTNSQESPDPEPGDNDSKVRQRFRRDRGL
jgi:hypothetical protein